MSFKLCVTHKVTEPQFNSWVEFAMSRNVGGAVSHRPFFLVTRLMVSRIASTLVPP